LEPAEYINALNRQLSYLIAFTRNINELDMAGALFQESRGAQDHGWTTTITAYEVFREMRELGAKKEPLSKAEYRQFLCLYVHLAEAGGIYEVLLNLMGVVQLKPYNLWPFQDLVKVKQVPRRIIGPNANAMFRKLAETATTIGMTKLSSLLEITFRDDIRNGISHADYIIWEDGLRLRRRNGGSATVITNSDVFKAFNIGMMFFELFDGLQRKARQSFRPARDIIGRFSENPPMLHTVELHENGSFSISTSSPGTQTDACYERQKRINDRLGGCVFAAYVIQSNEKVVQLLEEVLKAGFDVPLIILQTEDKMTELENEISEGRLWVDNLAEEFRREGLLIASPFGFYKFVDVATFENFLPKLDDLEIV
jgi:hypothetical protein